MLATARSQRWEPAEVLRVLLGEEAAGRDHATIQSRRKRLGLPAGKTLDAWEEHARTDPQATQHALRTLEWVSRAENLSSAAHPGPGRATSSKRSATTRSTKARPSLWHTLESLAGLLRRHRADDSTAKAIGKLIRADLIIIDDVGLLPVSPDAAEALFRLVDAAYEKRSIALTSTSTPPASTS